MGNPYDDIRTIRLETDEFFPLSFCMDAYLNCEQDVQKTINYLNDLRDDKKELTPEERKQLEKYKCQAERRTRGGWTPGKIVGMIIGVIFIGLFIFLLVRHVNDDTPWGMLLSIIPGIIGGCIVISSFPKKHNGLSAREKELRLCNITGQICSLVFLLSLLAIIDQKGRWLYNG